MKITCASILLLCLANSSQSYAMELAAPSNVPRYQELREEIPMSLGQECPFDKISDLPRLGYLKSAKELPATEQGANSTVYKWNDKIIKISKKVKQADTLSKELKRQQKIYILLESLKNPGFAFAIPEKTYSIRSSDNKGMCFVEISKALPNKINTRFYDYINPEINRDNRNLFFDLGKALAQLQNSTTPTLENDGYYYGLQHGDFQIGNIFYSENNNAHTFTLIDLGDFAEHKRLILDPLYLIYRFAISYGSQDQFLELLKDATFKSKMATMITAFINGYVSKLKSYVAKQMNKNIQEHANLVDLFYLGDKYVYAEAEDVIKEARKKTAEFFNPIIKQAFATAYENAFGTSVSTIVKPQEGTPAQIKKSAPQATKAKDLSIRSLKQLSDLCNADKVELDLSMYPELEDLTGISACENLKKLYLPGTKVSNIEEIASLKNLEELDLSGLSSSPVGQPKSLWILPLAGYTDYNGSAIKTHRYPGVQKLKILKVYGIKHVHGYDELKKELPDLDIRTDSTAKKY